jgi:hypothetical protein
MVFCRTLPDTNVLRPPPACPGPAHPDLGGIHAQRHAFVGGVGEHVGEGPQAYRGRHREPAAGQQRPDLPDRPGHGATVHLERHGQGFVRHAQTQMRQRHQDPIGEAQARGQLEDHRTKLVHDRHFSPQADFVRQPVMSVVLSATSWRVTRPESWSCHAPGHQDRHSRA